MTRTRIATIAMAAAAIGGGTATAAVQSASAATARPASAATLSVASVKVASGTKNTAHQLLVNAKGLPVYLLTGDSSSKPLCKGSCLTYWPAVTSSSKPTLGKGVTGKVALWKHNGISQVTLNGHPLYTYAQDSKGAALGQGLKSFGGVWEVMQASGSPMAKSKSSSGGSGGGSGW